MTHQLPNEWRIVPRTKGLYSVSRSGRVRSRQRPGIVGPSDTWHELKGSRDSKGYVFIRLHIPGQKPRSRKVHRLVARAFLGVPQPGQQVNHKNGIKTDNRLENLEYVSCRENIRHCWENGLHGIAHCQGEANQNAKLTREAVIAMRQEYPTRSLAQLANQYGVTKQAVWSVIKRKTWVHV